MAHAQNSITIDRSPADFIAFLADGLNNLKWRDGVRKIELARGEPGRVGAEYRQVLAGPGGRSIDGDYRITPAIPGEELSFEVFAGALPADRRLHAHCERRRDDGGVRTGPDAQGRDEADELDDDEDDGGGGRATRCVEEDARSLTR